MKIRDDVQPPVRRGYGKWANMFAQIKHGQSVHAADHAEASSIQISFMRWAGRNGIEMKPALRRVDATDPDGAGYRIWFVNANGDTK